MLEPGLDRHEWESQWAVLEEELADDPAGALPELDRLVAEMLEARGYALHDPVARAGDDRDIVAEVLAAREITRPVDAGADGVALGDGAAAGEGLPPPVRHPPARPRPPGGGPAVGRG